VWVAIEGLAAKEPGALTDGPFGSNLKTSHYTESGPRVIRLQNIGEGIFHDEKAHIAREHFDRLRRHEARNQDVVVAMLGEKLPRACLVPEYVGPAIVKADCARLRVDLKIALPGLVVAGLNSRALRRQADELVHGVGRPRLGLRWLKTLRFPLAPLSEQHRIVEAIESYFTRLDDAAATLERVQRNLKRYRASVLKAAVEGRLVPTEAELARAERRDYEPAPVLLERILAERRRRWHEAGSRGKYQEPAAPDTTDLPDLPGGWCWATMDALADLKGGITKGQKRRPTDVLREVPYLRVANVQRGRIDLSLVKTILATEAEIDDLRLCPGDVLFNEGGDRDKLGRGWVWKGELPECIHQNHVFRARILTADLHPKFMSWYGNSSGQQYFFEQGKQTTNLASLNLTKLRGLPVPVPPLLEQIRIVEETERLLSLTEEAEVLVNADTRRCARLRQAILKWAFEGKLADQDPSDEPASVLLERIRTETAAWEASTTAGLLPRSQGRRGTMARTKQKK
jgi:type I restriction enzyme S subunit